MTSSEDTVKALRGALSVSPENVPLRLHLAETLRKLGRLDEAERQYRDALARQPENADIKVGLARVYYQQRKDSHALVIIEDLVSRPETPAAAFLLHARLLLRAGDVRFAVTEYKAAVEADRSVADPELAERLGIVAAPSNEYSEVVDGRVRATWEGEQEVPEVVAQRPEITFEQVGGMESLKEEIRLKIIYPLAHAEMFKAYGKQVGGGILMYGPPGCGKTHLARATAGEIQAQFLAVGINDVLEMWIGNSERNLHEWFEHARRNKPSVLFFDEVDALGASRSDMKHSTARQLINQFLAEMDGVRDSNDGVLILAATNAPWHLDSAFRRPGRFDRVLLVPPPDAAARAEILRIVCQDKPTEQIDYAQVAKKTAGLSGADLRAIVDVAVEDKLRQALKTGVPAPLRTKDLLQAAKRVKSTTGQWFATARNYALYSNQGGTYDELLKYMKLP